MKCTCEMNAAGLRCNLMKRAAAGMKKTKAGQKQLGHLPSEKPSRGPFHPEPVKTSEAMKEQRKGFVPEVLLLHPGRRSENKEGNFHSKKREASPSRPGVSRGTVCLCRSVTALCQYVLSPASTDRAMCVNNDNTNIVY